MASLQLPNCKKKSAAHKNGYEVLVDSIFLFVHQKPDLRINVSIVWLCDSDYWGRDETTDNNNWTPFKINPYQSWCDSHWLSIHFSWNSSIRPHNHTRAPCPFREGSNFPSLLGRNVLKGNSKKCNPQRFYCDTRNFYSPELFSTNSHDRVRKFG